MATLKSQIQGLIDYANETTGAGDTLLGDAVKTLCDGYGQGGGGTTDVESNDIDFYDYDGTRVASWTLAELASKTELPTPPSHDGLTFQGWNWTLAQLKSSNRMVDVGAHYVTTDGKTKLYLEIPYNAPSHALAIMVYLKHYPSTTSIIEWGDGTTDTITGSGNMDCPHTYSRTGNYVIAITLGANAQFGRGDNYVGILGQKTFYKYYLAKVELGTNAKLTGGYALQGFYRLKSVSVPIDGSGATFGSAIYCACLHYISVPPTATSFSSFNQGNALKAISLPPSITSLPANGLRGNPPLERVVIPTNITTIPAAYAQAAESVKTIVIPQNITTINGDAFRGIGGLMKVRFEGTTPPTLGNSNVFLGCHPSCVFSVPTGCLSAYTSATNYPSSSTFTYIEE